MENIIVEVEDAGEKDDPSVISGRMTGSELSIDHQTR